MMPAGAGSGRRNVIFGLCSPHRVQSHTSPGVLFDACDLREL